MFRDQKHDPCREHSDPENPASQDREQALSFETNSDQSRSEEIGSDRHHSRGRTRGPAGGDKGSAAGTALALGAYVIWGAFPLYFHALRSVPALQVLAHRIVWSLLFLAILISLRREWKQVGKALRNARPRRALLCSSIAIAINWGVFIWAVAAGRVLECSLGYFLNPLVMVALAVMVLQERLSAWQWLAVTLAAAGVSYQVVVMGTLPWVALVIGFSFAIYGLVRKTAPVEPLPGLLVEALLLSPVALGFLLLQAERQIGAFAAGDLVRDLLLAASGPLTALPLILFVAGARRVRLATLGLLQYVTPTGHFLLAVAVFGEPLSSATLVTFGLIWTALLVFSADAWFRRGRGFAATAEG